MEHLLKTPLDEARWQLCKMAFGDCGLSVGDSVTTSYLAFIASKCEFYGHPSNEALLTEARNNRSLCLQQLTTAFDHIQHLFTDLSLDELLQKVRDLPSLKLQHLLSQSCRVKTRDRVMALFPPR